MALGLTQFLEAVFPPSRVERFNGAIVEGWRTRRMATVRIGLDDGRVVELSAGARALVEASYVGDRVEVELDDDADAVANDLVDDHLDTSVVAVWHDGERHSMRTEGPGGLAAAVAVSVFGMGAIAYGSWPSLSGLRRRRNATG